MAISVNSAGPAPSGIGTTDSIGQQMRSRREVEQKLQSEKNLNFKQKHPNYEYPKFGVQTWIPKLWAQEKFGVQNLDPSC